MLQSTASVGNNGVKVLVYGRAGTGKTTLAATVPAPVILSAESGLLSLRRFNLPFWEIKTIHDLRMALSWAATSAEARQFATIFIDSVSEIAEVILAHEKRNTKDPRKAYGEVLTQTIELVRQFRDIPGRHVVVTAKEEQTKDEASGMVLLGPSMPGNKLGQQLPYFFDEVFRLFVGKDGTGVPFRALRTAPDFQSDAKDRSGALDELEPPDLSHVFRKITGA